MIIVPIFDICKEKIDNFPKFFHKINNKFIFQYCLQSIDLANEKLLFIISERDSNNFGIDTILSSLYECEIKILKKSSSLLDTLYQSKNSILENEIITIFAPPFTYFEPMMNIKNIHNGSCHILLFKSNNPQHCYVNIKNNKIINIKEKEVIGKYAILGIYSFKNKNVLFYNDSNEIFHMIHCDNQKNYLSDILIKYLEKNIEINYINVELVYPFKDKLYIDYLKKSIKNEIVFGISCDHSGYNTKIKIIDYLKSKLLKFIDYGAFLDKDCDYQDYISNQYKGYIKNEFNFGISICRSGQGVNISANHTGFTSALIYNNWSAQMAIEHNNSNFFCFSDKLVSNGDYSIEDIIEIILKHKFLGGRFLDRFIKVKKNRN